jgi:hypothetical protein
MGEAARAERGKYGFPFRKSYVFPRRTGRATSARQRGRLFINIRVRVIVSRHSAMTIYRHYRALHLSARMLQYADLSNTAYPILSKTVFAIFMVLVPILLLNMLIAMMGNTYAHVIEQSEKEFVKQVGSKNAALSFFLFSSFSHSRPLSVFPRRVSIDER